MYAETVFVVPKLRLATFLPSNRLDGTWICAKVFRFGLCLTAVVVKQAGPELWPKEDREAVVNSPIIPKAEF